MNLPDAQIRPEFRGVTGSEAVGLLDVWNVLYDSKWLIAAVTALGLAAATAYAFLMPPKYEATALIQIEEGNSSDVGSVGALRQTAALFETRELPTAEISILRSNLVLEHAIDRMGLDVTAHPRYVPVIGYWLSRHATQPSEPGFLGAAGYVRGNESIAVGKFVVPRESQGSAFTVVLTPAGYSLRGPDGEHLLDGSFGRPEHFTINGKPGDILVNGAVGLPGAEFIVRRDRREAVLNALQRSLTVEEQGKESGVLRAKLTGDSPERVAMTLNDIGEYYVKQHVERKVAQVDEALKFVTWNLPNVREQLRRAEEQLSRLRSQRGALDAPMEARLSLEESRGLQATLQELQRKREDLSATYLPQHPVMRALEAQIATVTSQLAKVGGRIQTMPALEQELISLNRELKVNSDLYVSLLNSAQQLGLARQTRGGNIRVVDAARVPDEPIGPTPAAILGVGALAGLVLGVSCALARAALRRGVVDPAQIEDEASVSVLTTVPMSLNQRSVWKRLRRAANDPHVLAARFPLDPAVDSLRNMLTLLPNSAQDESNIVVITGPTHSIGKSFISVNLAAVVGGSGARALLVDADLHKGKLAKSFDVSHDRGLTDLLDGRASFDQIVHRDVMPNVDFVSIGHLAGNPANVFWARSIREVLKEQLRQYDVVIFDSPPVLAAADAVVLAQQASAVFLVARAEVTSLRDIQVSTRFLMQRGVHVKGVIFSGVDINKRQNDIYGYSGYRYLSAR